LSLKIVSIFELTIFSETLSVGGKKPGTRICISFVAIEMISQLVPFKYTLAPAGERGKFFPSMIKVSQALTTDCETENISAGISTVHIFPNPNQGIFYLENKRLISVSITDIYGKVFFENNFEAGVHTIDLRPNSSALYLVKVFDVSNSKVFKLIKSD